MREEVRADSGHFGQRALASMSLGGVTLQGDECPKLRPALRANVHTLLRAVYASGVVPQRILRRQVHSASRADVTRHLF